MIKCFCHTNEANNHSNVTFIDNFAVSSKLCFRDTKKSNEANNHSNEGYTLIILQVHQNCVLGTQIKVQITFLFYHTLIEN
jgi:hypothetical protein